MNMISTMVTVGAAAAVGLGVGAASASAYSISGGSYVGTATASHTLTVAGAFTLTCPASNTTFTGTATGAASSSFTPSYGPGCRFFGLPASVTQSGQWTSTVTSGGPSTFGGDLHIPASSTTTIEVPSTGCTVTVTGTQNFSGVGTTTNVPGGVQASFHVSGIVYTASGCPFASGTDGTYSTNGNVDIAGITIS